MRSKENISFDKTPGRYPFSTPDGYFDNLTARIMDSIPEESQEAKKATIKLVAKRGPNIKWLATAAVAASLALVATVSLKLVPATAPSIDDEGAGIQIAYADEEMSVDEMMLYSMVDNSDIYDYLAGYEY